MTGREGRAEQWQGPLARDFNFCRGGVCVCVLHSEQVEGDPRGRADEKELRGSRRKGVYSTRGQ